MCRANFFIGKQKRLARPNETINSLLLKPMQRRKQHKFVIEKFSQEIVLFSVFLFIIFLLHHLIGGVYSGAESNLN